jgi:hypothetical protein
MDSSDPTAAERRSPISGSHRTSPPRLRRGKEVLNSWAPSPLLRASSLRNRLSSPCVPQILKVSPFSIEVPVDLSDPDYPPAAGWPPARARKSRPDARHKPLRRFEDFMLPYTENSPSDILQPLRLDGIPPAILGKLFRPELLRASRSHVMVRAAVPETAVDEHRDARAGENDVRSPSWRRSVYPITETGIPKCTAKCHLRASVPAPDPCHLLRSVQRHHASLIPRVSRGNAAGRRTAAVTGRDGHLPEAVRICVQLTVLVS